MRKDTTVTAPTPRKLACPSCGAAIPSEASAGSVVKCENCGTTYTVPGERSGGINISTSGGTVTIGGDVVGGDKIVTATNITTGISGGELVELLKQFAEINRRVDARSADPKIDRDELKDTVRRIEEEVKKGERADPDKVERWLTFLASMADDIFQVTAATLVNPAAGVARAIQLIAQKAMGSRSRAQTAAPGPASESLQREQGPLVKQPTLEPRGQTQTAAPPNKHVLRRIFDTIMSWLRRGQ